jgi:hypothetical protein
MTLKSIPPAAFIVPIQVMATGACAAAQPASRALSPT